MKKNHAILFFLFFSMQCIAQHIQLKIVAKDSTQTKIFAKTDFQKNHVDSIAVDQEIIRISEVLKRKGYFTNTVKRIRNSEKNVVATFFLGPKTDSVFINNKQLRISIERLKPFLDSIANRFEKQGKSFSKVQLSNLNIQKNILFADLKIIPSKKRNIDRVLVKGFDFFPKSFIKHHLNIQKNELFEKQKLQQISNNLNTLNFVSELKSPEVLFKKDSTVLYLYIKEQKNNSFDGLVNFASKEDGTLLFNGHLNLELSNILKSGERFQLFWNSIAEEKSELKIATEIPYIFNLPLSTSFSFEIFKQDDTFLNTAFQSEISYNFNSKISLAATYTSANSNNLKQAITSNNIEAFNNSFFGVNFSYKTTKKNVFRIPKFLAEINPNFGNRTFNEASENQFKIDFKASYLLEINPKNQLFIQNTSRFLFSDVFIENELFRIGGAATIRGFNEQSIYTSAFSFFNIEYRFLTSQKSYFYTISDIAQATINSQTQTLFGIGLGYLFRVNNSQINLSTAIGKTSKNNFDFDNAKLIIGWKNFF